MCRSGSNSRSESSIRNIFDPAGILMYEFLCGLYLTRRIQYITSTESCRIQYITSTESYFFVRSLLSSSLNSHPPSLVLPAFTYLLVFSRVVCGRQLVGQLVGWSVGWLVGQWSVSWWVVGWLGSWLVGWVVF
jgi:hypothetical protein